MKVCCVIVTYGRRSGFLLQVAEAAVRQPVDKIVIVDNGSCEESSRAIAEWSSMHSEKVLLHRFSANEGSAKGFKTGLQIARQTNCEYLWLLDDDNLPAADALQVLKQYWGVFKNTRDEDEFALASMRQDRAVFRFAMASGKPDALLWPRNSFLGFHIRLIFKKIAERITKRQQPSFPRNGQPLRINASFYGGLFINKAILDKIGLPQEDMVLYADDFCFTYPITLQRGEIWLVPGSVISDIDTPFYLPRKKGVLYHSTLDAPGDSQIYYVIRNSLYCTKKYLLTNRFIYSVNKIFFLFLVTIVGMIRGKFKRLKLIYGAIQDGEHARLGANSRYPLK